MNSPVLELTPEYEKELRLKIAARILEKSAQPPQGLKNKVFECIPSRFKKFARKMAAKTPKAENSTDVHFEDEQGRIWISKADMLRQFDQDAIARHGNDPFKRFDEWGFPGTLRERQFLMKHDFGDLLESSLKSLKSGGWVHAFGNVGNGKTALAIRCAWELLKDRPSEKATFISMNQYALDKVNRDNAETEAIKRGEQVYSASLNFHRIVILDDLDKVKYNDYYLRVCLDLVTRLKDEEHAVFVTSNCSLTALYKRYEEMHDMRAYIDRLRQMCLILREFKEKSRRRYEN